jgi:hypothetical protein
MQIKYAVLCYIQYWGCNPYVKEEVELPNEPTHEQIKEALSKIMLYDSDFEIDYSTGAVLPDYAMPRKSKVQRVYAIVEKRYYELQ